MPYFILYVLFTCLAFTSRAQSEQQYVFTNITARDGLASNHVNNVVQDDQGYVWIGTINGLQRYDGARFITFHHNPADSKSIPSSQIRFLYVDQKNNLWINFDNGQMGKFNTRTFVFTPTKIQVTDENFLLAERSMTEDSSGNLFLLFNFIMFTTYNEASNEFSAAHNFLPGPTGWKITGLAYDARTKKYWMGFDSGLCIYNARTRHLNYLHHNPDRDPAIDYLSTEKGLYGLYVDSKQRLWFCTWPAGSLVHCYDLRKQQPLLSKFSLDVTFPYYHEPEGFIEHRNGSIWVFGTSMLGQFDEKNNQFINLGHEDELKKIPNNRVESVYQDRENNLWVCTHNYGIYQFNPSAQLFKSFSHPGVRENTKGTGGVMSFIEEADKTLLYSAWGEGLFRCDSNYKPMPLQIKGIPEKNTITAWDMCSTRSGKIWMGLQDGNLLIYDPSVRSATQYHPTTLENRTVRQVVEDRQGNVWLGTQSRGVFKWSPGTPGEQLDKGVAAFPAVPKTLIEKLYIDRQGALWVSTIVDGVYKINTATGKVLAHFTDKGPIGKRLLSRSSADVLQYDDTTLVIAAGGLNILNTKTNTFRYLSSFEGLPSNIINSIEKDDQGELWVSFQIGICRVNLTNNTISFYDREDGMANDNFNVAASYRMSNGNLLFGSGNDFTVLHPRNFKYRTVPNDVQVTGFFLSNRSLQTDSLLQLKQIELPHSDNSLLIHFSSLSYLPSNKLIYYYRLDGLDKDWIKAGNSLQAVYSHLPSGKYTFHVKCQNADGVACRNITQLNITVSKPFWKTWIFYTILVLGCIALFFRLDKERMQRKTALHQVRSEIAGNLHSEVNLALHNINILSEMAKIKAVTDPQKSKEHIDQIHSKSHNMIMIMEDMLWSLSPENDSMQKTVERMREYIDELKNNHGVNISMVVDQKVAALELNMKLRHEAYLVFKEGIKNLVESGTRHCDIQIGLSKNDLLFIMQFHTASCNLQQLQLLLHRQDLEKHLQSIRATLEVQVQKTNSLLTLHIPFA